MQDWWKWHVLMWTLRLERWFGVSRRKAANDVLECSLECVERIKNGKALTNESEYAQRFCELENVSLKRKSLFNKLVIFIAFILLVLTQGLMQRGNWSEESYQSYVAIGVVFFLIMGLWFVWRVILRSHHHDEISESEYENAGRWLHYMGEKDYRPMPVWKRAIIVLGLGLESFAIGIVIAVAASMGNLTEGAAQVLGAAIGTALAILLAFSSHQAGAQLYRAGKRKSIRLTIEKNPNNSMKEFLIGEDPLFENSFLADITWLQKYGALLLAGFLVVSIGLLGLINRAELNKVFIQEDVAPDYASSIMKEKNVESESLPPDLLQAQLVSAREMESELKKHELYSIYAALTILFLLMVGMNGLGVLFGYQHSFAHRTSEICWRKRATYTAVKDKSRRREEENKQGQSYIIITANRHLSKYHALLVSISKNRGANNVLDALQERGPYRMENHSCERQEEKQNEVH